MNKETLRGAIDLSAKPWRERVGAKAETFAINAVNMFRMGLTAAEKDLPTLLVGGPPSVEDQRYLIEVFFDRLLGMMVGIVCTYIKDSEEMEDIVVDQIRIKFHAVRKQRKESKENVQ